ncbi:beta-defensin 121 [Cavia porcellus]|uniref:beta-defensin 121 n=1 Tax=Cavia porcellus TaxID=10141 RepID=UPI0000F64AD2|nr:beta-defensin 121 [Cavia porcellus]
MKLLLLTLAVTLYMAETVSVRKCWGASGKCRATCKANEVFYILCKSEDKCCVTPKYVPQLVSSKTHGRQRSSAV